MLENVNDISKAVECSNDNNCTRENNAPISYADKYNEFSCIFGCMSEVFTYENVMSAMRMIFGGMAGDEGEEEKDGAGDQ